MQPRKRWTTSKALASTQIPLPQPVPTNRGNVSLRKSLSVCAVSSAKKIPVQPSKSTVPSTVTLFDSSGHVVGCSKAKRSSSQPSTTKKENQHHQVRSGALENVNFSNFPSGNASSNLNALRQDRRIVKVNHNGRIKNGGAALVVKAFSVISQKVWKLVQISGLLSLSLNSSGESVKIQPNVGFLPLVPSKAVSQSLSKFGYKSSRCGGESGKNRLNFRRKSASAAVISGNDASERMKTSRSELSLLEQKKLQWAKERDELNGLWSPWGRQTDSSGLSSSTQMQASYPSPTNVVSSSYVANLGIDTPTYSQSQSECYLPPINPTIAQQPRQKAKVWNAEFQPEDYRYENGNLNPPPPSPRHGVAQGRNQTLGIVHPRKASLPNYMFEGGDGDGHHNNYYHQQMVVQQHNKLNSNNIKRVSADEEGLTSGYYSENNNVDDHRSHSIEIPLKPTSRERSYQEEVTIQKAIAIRPGDQSPSPRVIVHKIYTQNGETYLEQDEPHHHREVIVNQMTASNYEKSSSLNRLHHEKAHHHHSYESSKSPGGSLPRNHAMRSSLTIGVDASGVDAYGDLERKEREQWLNELDKQREEQRMRKQMEKEERRPRWGEKGIGVGHFWEPSDCENSHLPAPPHSSRGKSQSLGEYAPNSDGSYISHPGQSQTPPAWLERGLTRMQNSQSQPSLLDPQYVNELEYTNYPTEGSFGGRGHATGSRSLTQSTADLRSGALSSPTGDILDRTLQNRGHNVADDPVTVAEREKKRIANQEHLEALKKQIEERQQKQKEEKERRLQEEREEEARIAKQREIELQRLEVEKRGKMPVNADMPNCVDDGESTGARDPQIEILDPSTSKISQMLERANIAIHDPGEEKDIEIVQRQSVMVATSAPEAREEEQATGESCDSSSQVVISSRRLSRQDQSVMTDTGDTFFERTLTPSIQRSQSLSLLRSSREFGTQTELSDGSCSSGSSCGSGKNGEKTRSHNSLLDKKSKEKDKKTEERPRWGSNPIKKQYVKQSEKDPNYITRMKRRHDRLKRMEEERTARGDTGTESEDVSIPFHRIRQRRRESISPQRRVGIAPMKAKPLDKTDMTGPHQGRLRQAQSESVEESGRPPVPVKARGYDLKKNSRSETQLNRSTADIIDRNFGSVAGINVMGTSEESSGFSTPFLPVRQLGSGSTGSGSGTTGSGSGIQSPDLAYHAYQANKSTRDERNFVIITSGRDSHVANTGSKTTVRGTKGKATVSGGASSRKEFVSNQAGFIHQQDFDEMPINPSKAGAFPPLDSDSGGRRRSLVNGGETGGRVGKMGRSVEGAPPSRQRKRSMSPSKKQNTSPVKTGKNTRIQTKVSNQNKNKAPFNLEDHNKRQSDVSAEPEQRPTSPPVPALLKKMQMGLQPDESGRISSLPTEFPDILVPLPTIPIGLLSPNPSRLSSASSSATGKIDIDIAVSPKSNPEIRRLFAAAEERIKQRQLTAIIASNNGLEAGTDSARSRTSFEADIGNISVNFEPVVIHTGGESEVSARGGKPEVEIPTSARLSIVSRPISPRSHAPSRASESAKHEAFIASILSRKEVKEQLSARESELSEKGIIEFSIRLPSTSSGDELIDDYQDPLLTERRRHTAQWLYGSGGGKNGPQKQAILTNLSTLKKGIALPQQEWKVNHSDSD